MTSRYLNRSYYPGCFYHVYNRGAHQQLLFRDAQDYQTFSDFLRYYILHPTGTPPSVLDRMKDYKDPIFVNNEKVIDLLAYCLMPNHFHLMVKQVSSELNVSNLLRRISVGYAMYYNQKYHHSGTIFQGKYKNILIENEYHWLYLSKYIHRNPLHLQRSDLCKTLSEYPYSSYQTYLGIRSTDWIETQSILGIYNREKAITEYKSFVEDGSDSGDIEQFTIDADEIQFTKIGSL